MATHGITSDTSNAVTEEIFSEHLYAMDHWLQQLIFNKKFKKNFKLLFLKKYNLI